VAKALIERFDLEPAIADRHMSIGRDAPQPERHELARCVGLLAQSTQSVFTISLPWRRPWRSCEFCLRGFEGLSVLVLDPVRSAVRPRVRAHRKLPVSTGISGIALMARAYTQAQFGVETAIPTR
jgi:thioredoxin reductase (NADPH)